MRIVWNVFLRCRSFAINMEWTWLKIRQDSEIPAGTGEPRTTWGFHDVLLARFRWVWRFFSPQFRRIYDFGEKPRVTTPTARNVKILREVFAQDLMCFYIYYCSVNAWCLLKFMKYPTSLTKVFAAHKETNKWVGIFGIFGSFLLHFTIDGIFEVQRSSSADSGRLGRSLL